MSPEISGEELFRRLEDRRWLAAGHALSNAQTSV